MKTPDRTPAAAAARNMRLNRIMIATSSVTGEPIRVPDVVGGIVKDRDRRKPDAPYHDATEQYRERSRNDDRRTGPLVRRSKYVIALEIRGHASPFLISVFLGLGARAGVSAVVRPYNAHSDCSDEQADWQN